MDFLPFPKLSRLNREIVITEKLDGTNAQVYIRELEPEEIVSETLATTPVTALVGNLLIYAGSRTKWVTPGKQNDNYGFAAWVAANADELAKLGPGQHFGEWWGGNIQRGYGLTEKRFSLFNVGRWASRSRNVKTPWCEDTQDWAPVCCDVVPVLYRGLFSEECIRATLDVLRFEGSVAAPGFMKPEGVVIYHTAANSMFKVTLEGDEKPKGKVTA